MIYNSTDTAVRRELPEGNWELLLDGENSFLWREGIGVTAAEAAPFCAVVLGKRE